jgi:D-amino-acid oxidase
MPQVLVVGAGAIGLTAAIRLREAGLDADVVAREPPAATTSAVAAALWYPYRAFPRERVALVGARLRGPARARVRAGIGRAHAVGD